MTTPKFIIAFMTILVLTSCSRTYRLSEKDNKWMSYNGNETLVFNSNTGDKDTIFFLGKHTEIADADMYSPWSDKYEVISIFCKHSDPSPPDGKHRYLENSFMALTKSKDGKARLEIEFSAKDAWFYRLDGPKVDSLDKIKPTTLQTKLKTYDDVYIIDDIDLMNFKQRSNYVTKAYWSKLDGLIRFDKQDSVYWELTKKYSP
jgi:hypothetical protein